MKSWSQAVADGIVSGSVASVLSTLALSVNARRETGHAAAATNAISHWVWPIRAFLADDPSLRYTGTGYLIHHAMSVMWAVLYEKALVSPSDHCTPARAIGAGIAAASFACLVDYTVTPRRLKPGFERRLSIPALASVYAAFGIGLALTTMLRGHRAAAALLRCR